MPKAKQPAPLSPLQMFCDTIRFVGRKQEGASDKIWGCLRSEGRFGAEYVFWGRACGPWRFKRGGSYSGARWVEERSSEKEADGYSRSTIANLGIEKELFDAFTKAVILQDFHERSAG